MKKEILSYYEQNDEVNRLSSYGGQLEFARTQELVKRFLKPPPGLVLDVGGGSGPYSCWLAKEGYAVHLIDPVPFLVEQARQASNKQPEHPIISCSIGDARKLDYSDGIADAVLMFGPVYHLTERTERLAALSEAFRVLKKGGMLFTVGISRFASALDGLFQGFNNDPDFLRIVEQDLKDGQHRNATDKTADFTDAYLHLPNELLEEIKEAGFQEPNLFAIEGPAWLLPNLEFYWTNTERRESLLKIIRKMESEPAILGASAHMLCIAKK